MDTGVKNAGEESAAAAGIDVTPAPSHVTSNGRPSSTGRVKNLRRRFTTPAEIISKSGTALDLATATQIYSQHADRKPSDAAGHDITVTESDSLDDIQVMTAPTQMRGRYN